MAAVVDSSGWIEFFIGGSNGDCFAEAIQDVDGLIVPAISITEVYRWVLREVSAADALIAAASMKQGHVVPLDARLAVIAAELSHRHRLPLADGIIYATARTADAELLTQDSDLQGLPGVRYFAHPAKEG
ncbi:MAG: type II toxin-antitoxin system VapC family toxin [Verrucomicrobiae bacterium]|nr:type II toxin-antitoxin system VapC family toxin [Verrucomicrobiae bacterium]MCP5522873.1 type II toxin-antitoxin system VapC family toxin [Verrucomicrobiales bacterium]